MVRRFIIDGAKALSKAIGRTFGKDTPIQRCQVHTARNIAERLPKEAHAAVRKALRQAWEMDDAPKAEQRIRNLARTWRGGWRRSGPALPPPSSKGWTRFCASSA